MPNKNSIPLHRHVRPIRFSVLQTYLRISKLHASFPICCSTGTQTKKMPDTGSYTFCVTARQNSSNVPKANNVSTRTSATVPAFDPSPFFEIIHQTIFAQITFPSHCTARSLAFRHTCVLLFLKNVFTRFVRGRSLIIVPVHCLAKVNNSKSRFKIHQIKFDSRCYKSMVMAPTAI